MKLIALVRGLPNVSPDKDSPLKVSSLEVKAIATTVAPVGKVAMADQPKTSRWKQPTTCSSHYLRDMAETLEGLKRLVPLTATQV